MRERFSSLYKLYQDELKSLENNYDKSQYNQNNFYERRAFLYAILDLFKKHDDIENRISINKNFIVQNQTNPDIDYQDLIELARLENLDLEKEKKALVSDISEMLQPADKNDSKSVILEIRAGVGGDEAGIFANDLFRMYSRFCAMRKWEMSIISMTKSEDGSGVREVICQIKGKNVYGQLKYENGVHRVQRIPKTESQGRIHTSAVSVVVLPELDAIDIQINPKDLNVEVFRSSGNGGQSVNTTDSAVRITHIPSGIMVSCQHTKDQIRNREMAMKVLYSRLYQKEIDKRNEELSLTRKSSIKTGNRSDKIKTYNFPQDRLTDHRIKQSWSSLEKILAGEIETILKVTARELTLMDSQD